MAANGFIIETGVDKLVRLVKERARISMEDAAKQLGLSLTIIEEWADFLEEEGIISIEYKFTKPFLVERKLTKIQIDKKAKEFTSERELFVRKAEGTLHFLEREAEKLKTVKSEFDKLKKDLGIETESVKNEIAQLEKYREIKANLDAQIQKLRSESENKIGDMTQRILREQKKYYDILNEAKKEAKNLKKEKKAALSMEESEKILRERLNSLSTMINRIEKKMADEDSAIQYSEQHIEQLKNMADSMNQNLEKEKGIFEPLVKQSQEQEKKIKEWQEKILNQVSEKESKLDTAKKASEKFKKFFDKKMKVADLIDKVNQDRDDMEKELTELVKKARSFQLASKSTDIGKEMLNMEKKFREVDKKKGLFEKEFKKLGMIFKKNSKIKNAKKKSR
ncbi:hypothetical protein ISS05_04695 [Candidatus Woesearchaeota archaeon]|nr:hypothetical protein [Candidatus Woesearchaeota archaeon]